MVFGNSTFWPTGPNDIAATSFFIGLGGARGASEDDGEGVAKTGVSPVVVVVVGDTELWGVGAVPFFSAALRISIGQPSEKSK